ncbi:hypothetical protein EDB86DRAFT_2833738 [Lactarius hatsudake]|nr:hypothetical protein EDB86DRAFT_2833738 [Lactarius hatsudake]
MGSAHSARLARELNRLGVLVGLSHTSDDIALAALKISCGTRDMELLFHMRAARDIPRNVPDEVLWHVGAGAEQLDGVWYRWHRERLMASIAAQPGLKMSRPTPYSRRWSSDELRGFTGGTFLPVFAGAEDVVREGVAPAQDLYEKRADIPKKH